MSTLISLHSKALNKDMKIILEPLILTMFSYCLKGFEQERLFNEDKNLFIQDFLDQGEDDLDNFSIRSVVTEFVEEACVTIDFERGLLERLIATFA